MSRRSAVLVGLGVGVLAMGCASDGGSAAGVPMPILSTERLSCDAAADILETGLASEDLDDRERGLVPTPPFEGVTEVRFQRVDATVVPADGLPFGPDVPGFPVRLPEPSLAVVGRLEVSAEGVRTEVEARAAAESWNYTGGGEGEANGQLLSWTGFWDTAEGPVNVEVMGCGPVGWVWLEQVTVNADAPTTPDS